MYNHYSILHSPLKRPDHGCILIAGPEAESFLQGQLTCDVKNCPTLGGYCNTQGRLISLFYLFKNPEPNDGYILECPLDILDTTLATLKKYAMFSKVTFQNISDKSQSQTPVEVDDWQTLDILAKIPQLTSKTQGLFLPHHLNLPELGAVSFKKGCYLGQEIIARMHYRSKIKKHLAILEVEPTDYPLEPGSPLYSLSIHTSEPVGHIVTIANNLILASMLDAALNTELRAGELTGPYLTGRI